MEQGLGTGGHSVVLHVGDGGTGVQGHAWLQDFKDSLSYMRSCLKNNTTQHNQKSKSIKGSYIFSFAFSGKPIRMKQKNHIKNTVAFLSGFPGKLTFSFSSRLITEGSERLVAHLCRGPRREALPIMSPSQPMVHNPFEGRITDVYITTHNSSKVTATK